MIKLEEFGINKAEKISTIANLTPTYELESENIANTVRNMISSSHRRIPIISSNNNLVGIITYTDIIDGLLRGFSRSTQLSSFMKREIISSDISDTIGYVLQKMLISMRGGLPLTKKSKLSGVVSERDFIRPLARKYLSIQVSDVMSQKPLFVSPKTSILNCMKTIINTHYRRLPVVEGNEVAGIITGLDIIRYINDINYNQIALNENIEEIMITPVFHITEQEDVSDAIKLILQHNIGGIPVINEENSLLGIITERDIIELL